MLRPVEVQRRSGQRLGNSVDSRFGIVNSSLWVAGGKFKNSRRFIPGKFPVSQRNKKASSWARSLAISDVSVAESFVVFIVARCSISIISRNGGPGVSVSAVSELLAKNPVKNRVTGEPNRVTGAPKRVTGEPFWVTGAPKRGQERSQPRVYYTSVWITVGNWAARTFPGS